MPLPPYVIEEIVAKARGDREVGAASPRGVSDLRFDFDDGAIAKRTIRLFPSDGYRDDFVDRIGSEFVRDLFVKSMAVTECAGGLRMRPAEVGIALDSLIPDIRESVMSIGLGVAFGEQGSPMDVDESSDYEGSGGEFETDEADEVSVRDVLSFYEAFPPVEGIVTSDAQFLDDVAVPLLLQERFMINVRAVFGKGHRIAGEFKRAFFAYTVKTLSYQYQILDQLEEASTLLELALWKAKIGGSGGDDMPEGERKKCRKACGADIVAPDVLPFLFEDACARSDRHNDWLRIAWYPWRCGTTADSLHPRTLRDD